MPRLLCVSAALALVATPAVLSRPAAPETFASPLRVVGSTQQGAVTHLALDGGIYAGLKQAGAVVLADFPLDASRRVDLDLERFEVFTADARIVVGSPDGDVPVPRPDVVLLRGKIVGQPDSTVFLSNTGLVPGHEYFNIISSELGPAGVGTGPHLGLWSGSAAGRQSLRAQIEAPLGTFTHFVATDERMNWGSIPAQMIPLEGICIDVTGGVLRDVSPVMRFEGE